MYDLVILGGGPAGLTAAIYAIRKRLNVLLVSRDLGGKTNLHLKLPNMENYRVVRGIEIVDKFRRELEYLDFAHLMDAVLAVKPVDNGFAVQTRDNGELLARSILVATGARQHKLSVPGEDEFLFRGLCYSAMSYAQLFIDKKTVVIGSGELALRSAAELATVAEHVHLVGTTPEVASTVLGQKLHSAANVTVMVGSQVARVLGDGYCSQIVVTHPDGSEEQLDTDGAFVETGLSPNNSMVEGLLEVDHEGFIVVDSHCRTSLPGVFAAGDVTSTHTEQVLVAVGEGAKAVISIYDYLLPTL